MRRTLLILGLALFCCVGAGADTMAVPGFRWSLPAKFGELEEAAPGAYVAGYPADVAPEKRQMEVVVIVTPRDSVTAIREAGVAPETLTLKTFLGLEGAPEQINKTAFMGDTEARRVWRSDLPRPNMAHVFQKSLPDGAIVTVALRDYGTTPPSLVGDTLLGISNSFAQN